MLNVGSRRIFLCRQAVDMRKSFDSLSDLVRTTLGMDPLGGDVFVFIGKDRTRAKVLIWERSGFWLCAKRLETARFDHPAVITGASRTAVIALTSAQLMMLLEQVLPRALRTVAAPSLAR
jgi:transposase